MMKLLIAFNGGYGSGKTTACELLKQRYLGLITVLKFAQPLYDIQEFAYRRIHKVHPRPAHFVKDRKLLQWLGTEWGRELDQNLWVDLWKAEVRAAFSSKGFEVILNDDIRFDNEADAIHAMGGIVVQIRRDNNSAHALGGTGLANHASETPLRPELVDRVISNNGTIEEFEKSLLEVISDFKKTKGE